MPTNGKKPQEEWGHETSHWNEVHQLVVRLSITNRTANWETSREQSGAVAPHCQRDEDAEGLHTADQDASRASSFGGLMGTTLVQGQLGYNGNSPERRYNPKWLGNSEEFPRRSWEVKMMNGYEDMPLKIDRADCKVRPRLRGAGDGLQQSAVVSNWFFKGSIRCRFNFDMVWIVWAHWKCVCEKCERAPHDGRVSEQQTLEWACTHAGTRDLTCFGGKRGRAECRDRARGVSDSHAQCFTTDLH